MLNGVLNCEETSDETLSGVYHHHQGWMSTFCSSSTFSEGPASPPSSHFPVCRLYYH